MTVLQIHIPIDHLSYLPVWCHVNNRLMKYLLSSESVDFDHLCTTEWSVENMTGGQRD